MNRIIALFLSVIVISSCSEAQVKTSPSQANQSGVINKAVSATEFKALMNKKDRQLIDVRTPEEYNGGKIDDAVNIDYYNEDFKAQMAKLDKSKPTLVYCAAGGRSAKVASMLKEMGFKEVYDLKGGYSAWPKK